MRYLIDGYNLLFGLGFQAGVSLEASRGRMLDYLADALGEQARQATVVFDAARAPRGKSDVQEHRGIDVRFARFEEEADDLIEKLLAVHPLPRQLAVVSDDHRLQRAARRRRARMLSCQAFLDELARPPEAPAPAAGDKVAPANDSQYWLQEFAGLEDAPDAQELFDDFEFGSPDDEPHPS